MAKYVNSELLTDEKIEEFLNRCNLKVGYSKSLQNIYNNKSPIIRCGEIVIVHSYIDSEDWYKNLFEASPKLAKLFAGKKDLVLNCEIVLEDFYAERVTTSNEMSKFDMKILSEYYNMMGEVFGEEYIKEKNEYIKQLKNEVSKTFFNNEEEDLIR